MKKRIFRRTLYVVLLVILLLLLLRTCDGDGQRRVAAVNNDSTVASSNQVEIALATPGATHTPQPYSEEKKSSSNYTVPAARPVAEAPRSGTKNQLQLAEARAEAAQTKAPAEGKNLPEVAREDALQEPVAVSITVPPGLRPDSSHASSNETLGETFTEPITGIKFILVRGGCYRMGSDHGKIFEGPMHEVCIDDFYLSKYEVTQKQWLTLMGRTQSHFYFQGKSRPAEWLNWGEAQDFIRELNRRSEATYRLPTEAEWEYAARSGGQDEKYSGTNDEESLEDFAWYRANSNGQSRFIGMKKPNGLGLHDMSGNVREWCSDWYGEDYYNNSPRENPQGPDNGEYRVIRGGAWGLPKGLARTTYRDAAQPNQRRYDIGFRLALPAK